MIDSKMDSKILDYKTKKAVLQKIQADINREIRERRDTERIYTMMRNYLYTTDKSIQEFVERLLDQDEYKNRLDELDMIYAPRYINGKRKFKGS